MAFRWGIIGLGSIARKFAEGLVAVPSAELYAVASRSREKAEEFGGDFGAKKRYGSYAELADDPNVDAVYVATPHTSHRDDALLALNGGKPVLCEKPFTLNAAECEGLIKVSKSKQIFLMEAMWTRFMPVMVKIRELISEGSIGDVRLVEADFGFRAGFNPSARHFDPKLGGGALLDVGVYPISLASMLLGQPTDAVGLADLGESGVDEQSAYVLKYKRGELAVLSSAIRTNTAHVAAIYGTAGKIVIDSPWWVPKRLTVYRDGSEPEAIVPEFVGNGYNYEAVEVERCVADGKIESEILPHAETLAIMITLDKLRSQWGLVYPQEKV
jgi:dihydrodiol dehydrogenase / D-xylose 1-dehydrogenase (NADP)